MFVTNWISTTKIQKISEITNFFRHYFLSRTEVYSVIINKNFHFLFSIYLQMLHSVSTPRCIIDELESHTSIKAFSSWIAFINQ